MTERQEIAKKLREQPKELAKEAFYEDARYNIEPLLFEIVYEIICGSEEGLYDDIFTKTADLIDPTCHLVEVNDNDGTKYTCSNCGNFSVIELQLLDGFKYCPVCGARMAKGDNDEQ